MTTINSFDQLAAKLKEVEQAQSVSDDTFRQSLNAWKLSPSIFGTIPNDPLSSEYKTFQLDIYKRLTNQDYKVSNEETVFNFDHELLWPYPYGTKSAQTVGTSLMGYGWLIKNMDLPAESRILEIGSGYGSLTSHIARMGYRVTCLDISSSLLEYVKARTEKFPEQINTICGDMATVEIEGTFDAVIFNASLHHSLEHRNVIKRLNKILAPNGIIVFVAEPIVPANSEYVPYPWGVRLDGMSIWSICRWGWLELGFQEPYYIEMMQNAGWHLKRFNLGITGSTDVWIATKSERSGSTSVIQSASGYNYDVDLETEVLRLRKTIEGYEQGRFIKLMKRLNRS